MTCASFLNEVGKKTKCLLRISTVGPERGSADTVRDVHGFAMKLYTDQGNLDWVFNNTVSSKPPLYLEILTIDLQPMFFVRDPIKFPSLNRSHKRNPRTNAPDANMVSGAPLNFVGSMALTCQVLGVSLNLHSRQHLQGPDTC